MLGVCRRENIRHDLKISPDNQLSIFEEIFRSYEESIELADLDFILQIYEVSDQKVRDSFTNHFLLQRITPSSFKARFEVLKIYFVARFLAKGLQKLYKASPTKEIASALARNAIGQSQVNEWLAWQLTKLSAEKLRAAIRHAFEIISLPENNLTRHRASIALSHLISQLLKKESKAERTKEMLELLSNNPFQSKANVRNLTFAGKLKSFDFSELSFENCTFVDVNFSNCKFNEHTRFNSSRFEGSLEFTNCDGIDLADFDAVQRSDEAELAISKIKRRAPSSIVRQSFAEESLTRALRRFRGDAGFHSIQARHSQNGFNPRNPYNSEIWKALKRQGVVSEHPISGVSDGGYKIVDDREVRREVIQYLDNGIIGARLKFVLSELIDL